jgi:hypothetical protein
MHFTLEVTYRADTHISTGPRSSRAGNRTADASCMHITVNICRVNVCQCKGTITRHLHYHTRTLHLRLLTAADTNISTDRPRSYRAGNHAVNASYMHISVDSCRVDAWQCIGIITTCSHYHTCTLHLRLLTAADTHVSTGPRSSRAGKHAADASCKRITVNTCQVDVRQRKYSYHF